MWFFDICNTIKQNAGVLSVGLKKDISYSLDI